MSSSDRHSDDSCIDEMELALRIALDRSWVDTGSSSGSGVTPPVARRHNADAGPSRHARRSARPAQYVPPARQPPPPPVAAPRGERWVLVPAPPVPWMRTLKSEARAAHRERHRARERGAGFDAAAQSAGRRRVMSVPDEEEHLLLWVPSVTYHVGGGCSADMRYVSVEA